MSVTQFAEKFDNGLTVLGEQHPQAHTVAFSLLLPGGSTQDPATRMGLASLTQELPYKGAGPWDAKALATQIDQIGFQESHHAEREFVVFSGTVLPQHLNKALHLVYTTLQQPHLPPAGLEEIRQLALHQLMALEDAPAQKMFYELAQRFFPFPLSQPVEGTLESLPRVALSDIQGLWQRYSPQGAILSVAGAFDTEKVLEYLGENFESWRGEALAPLALGPRKHSREHVHKDTEQVQIGVAYDSVPLSHPDYFKARIGVLALSSGMSSRLMVEVRQKRGLVYSVFASYVTTRLLGAVLGYAGTTTERAQETLEVLLAELRRLGQGIQPHELDKAKTRLKTNFIVQGESTRSRAESMVREHFYAGKVWTLDEVMRTIDQLTLEEVNAYLERSAPRDFTIMTLGKQNPVQ